MKTAAAVLALLCAAALAGCSAETAKEEKPAAPDAGPADAKSGGYPLDTCLVSGEALGKMGDPYVFTHEGREVRLCCKKCLAEFEKHPAKYMSKLDAAKK